MLNKKKSINCDEIRRGEAAIVFIICITTNFAIQINRTKNTIIGTGILLLFLQIKSQNSF